MISLVTPTDPHWWLIAEIALAALLIACALSAASFPLAILVGRMFARPDDAAEQAATQDDGGWDWLYDQAHALPADAIWFGAEVLADLDELPEVRRG